jgi:hypothetical protein
MAIATGIVTDERQGIGWLGIRDSDSQTWWYLRGSTAQTGATVHVEVATDGTPTLLLASDRQPVLRQSGPALPGKMVVRIAGPAPGEGEYEYERREQPQDVPSNQVQVEPIRGQATSEGPSTHKYWQVAAGSAGSREYWKDFLKYGMAFVGGWQQINTMNEVGLGDRIILKQGKSQIIAAGLVVERDGKFKGSATQPGEEKEWLRDYDGWDLPAYCYVEWHRAAVPRAVKGLTRAAIQQVHLAELQQAAEEIIRAEPPSPVQPEPAKTEGLADSEMLDFLITLGLRPSTADELTNTLRHIRLLAQYYYKNCAWGDIREHETRTFLIAPFLLALGWSEQQIKIELGVTGGRIDIACFSRAYRRDATTNKPNNEDCMLILESKGFSQGLNYAQEQGKEYASEFPSCRVVFASNGYCYKAYHRKSSEADFEASPSAYLNLLRPKKRYPLDPARVDGGLKVLEYLLPQTWVSNRPR